MSDKEEAATDPRLPAVPLRVLVTVTCRDGCCPSDPIWVYGFGRGFWFDAEDWECHYEDHQITEFIDHPCNDPGAIELIAAARRGAAKEITK